MDGGTAALGAVGIAVAIPGLVDLCIKYGVWLRDKLDDYNKREELAGSHKFLVALHWQELELNLNTVKDLAPHLTETARDVLERLLLLLIPTLEKAIRSLRAAFDENEKLKKIKYVLVTKRILDGTIDTLDRWHTRFFETFSLVILRSTASGILESSTPVPAKLQNLQKEIRQRNEEKEGKVEVAALTLSEECLTALALKKTEGSVFSEKIYIPTNHKSQKEEDVRFLVRTLYGVDPLSMGLPKCKGYTEGASDYYEIFFQYPEGYVQGEAANLRSVLIKREWKNSHPLNQRFEVATRLARAVLFLHASGFVHKNIRPANILLAQAVLSDEDSRDQDEKLAKTFPRSLGLPLLKGFEYVRKDELKWYSQRIGEGVWQNDIYRHPTRQGVHPSENYEMKHDIYSLGVVLLELGLFKSLLVFDDTTKVYISNPEVVKPSIMKGFIAPYEKQKSQSSESSKENLAPYQKQKSQSSESSKENLRKELVNVATKRLPRLMGEKYSEIVVSCLEVCDKNFGDATAADSDGFIVGVRYIEHVLAKLEEISI
ncbi:hypothetical protein ACSS6W_000946 [Trichoderma asperelloides]